MKTATVPRKQFGDTQRLDASFHLSEGVTVRRILSNLPYPALPFKDVLKSAFHANRGRRIYVADRKHGTPFLGSATMLKSNLSDVKLLSNKMTPKIEKMLLDSNWILISCSGTIGKCVYSCGLHKGMAASQHVIRLVPNGQIPGGVIYAFLASKYGYSLLTQGTFGSVIQHIEPNHIESLHIPVFPEALQNKVHTLVTESAKLREEADAALKEAVSLFNDFAVSNKKENNIFLKKLSAFSFSWAANNNNLDVDKIQSIIGSKGVLLSELTSNIFAPPLFKHIYLDYNNGNPFLTGREVTYQNQRYYRWLSPRGVNNISDYKIEKGMLLIYKSGNTDNGILGYVTIADDDLHGACLSDHIIRVKFHDFTNACWTYAFLKSKAGETLLQSLATGTMIPFITPHRLANLLIPAPNEKKDSIRGLVDTYLQKRVQGNHSENEAIRLVEEEIEQWA